MVMADSPVNYDAVSVYDVCPVDLLASAKKLGASNKIVNDAFNLIYSQFGTKLGWAGKTAEEANHFMTRWRAVAVELWGKDDEHSSEGALNAVVAGVGTAAAAYAFTEHGIADFFNTITGALLGAGGEGDAGPPQSVTDVTTTAVTETW